MLRMSTVRRPSKFPSHSRCEVGDDHGLLSFSVRDWYAYDGLPPSFLLHLSDCRGDGREMVPNGLSFLDLLERVVAHSSAYSAMDSIRGRSAAMKPPTEDEILHEHPEDWTQAPGWGLWEAAPTADDPGGMKPLESLDALLLIVR